MPEIEKFILNWKGKVKECYNKNYPWNCPKGSFAMKSEVIGAGDIRKKKTRSISFCKYYGYCHRKFQNKV